MSLQKEKPKERERDKQTRQTFEIGAEENLPFRNSKVTRFRHKSKTRQIYGSQFLAEPIKVIEF